MWKTSKTNTNEDKNKGKLVTKSPAMTSEPKDLIFLFGFVLFCMSEPVKCFAFFWSRFSVCFSVSCSSCFLLSFFVPGGKREGRFKLHFKWMQRQFSCRLTVRGQWSRSIWDKRDRGIMILLMPSWLLCISFNWKKIVHSFEFFFFVSGHHHPLHFLFSLRKHKVSVSIWLLKLMMWSFSWSFVVKTLTCVCLTVCLIYLTFSWHPEDPYLSLSLFKDPSSSCFCISLYVSCLKPL